MTEEDAKQSFASKLAFTQEEFDKIISDRLMRERDKRNEAISTLTADNVALKDKLAKIEIDRLVKEAGLPVEWAQKLSGKTQDEIKAEIQTIKNLVEKSKPAPEPIGSDSNPPNSKPVLITRESVKRMSPQEINENWEAVQRALKSGI